MIACEVANHAVSERLLAKDAGEFADCQFVLNRYDMRYTVDGKTLYATGHVDTSNSIGQEVHSKYTVELSVTPGVEPPIPSFRATAVGAGESFGRRIFGVGPVGGRLLGLHQGQ